MMSQNPGTSLRFANFARDRPGGFSYPSVSVLFFEVRWCFLVSLRCPGTSIWGPIFVGQGRLVIVVSFSLCYVSSNSEGVLRFWFSSMHWYFAKSELFSLFSCFFNVCFWYLFPDQCVRRYKPFAQEPWLNGSARAVTLKDGAGIVCSRILGLYFGPGNSRSRWGLLLAQQPFVFVWHIHNFENVEICKTHRNMVRSILAIWQFAYRPKARCGTLAANMSNTNCKLN